MGQDSLLCFFSATEVLRWSPPSPSSDGSPCLRSFRGFGYWNAGMYVFLYAYMSACLSVGLSVCLERSPQTQRIDTYPRA